MDVNFTCYIRVLHKIVKLDVCENCEGIKMRNLLDAKLKGFKYSITDTYIILLHTSLVPSDHLGSSDFLPPTRT